MMVKVRPSSWLGTETVARTTVGRRRADELDILQADAENRPMYLESSSAANNVFYEKFGFEVIKTISFNRGREPITLDIMVREPQPRKLANSSPVLPQARCDEA
jgi:hypothetical protein